jgi:hypothetical protein
MNDTQMKPDKKHTSVVANPIEAGVNIGVRGIAF